MRACKLLGLTVAIVCVQISVGQAANENIVTTAGSYNPVVTVTDSIGLSATAACPWTVSSLSLLNANSGEGYGTGPFTTASFTPASNSLLVVLVGACYSGTSNNPANITMSGGGLSWTRQLAVSRANA